MREPSSFKQIPRNELVIVADLFFNLSQVKYKTDSYVVFPQDPDLILANRHYSSKKKRILVNIAEWKMLFESIPFAWRNTWRNTIALGNQQFNTHDFFATSLVNGDIRDVYEYIDGQLGGVHSFLM